MVLVFLVILTVLAGGILAELERSRPGGAVPAGSCPVCRRPVEADWLLCPHCRTLLKESCGGCGRQVPVYHRFCTGCGSPQGGGR